MDPNMQIVKILLQLSSTQYNYLHSSLSQYSSQYRSKYSSLYRMNLAVLCTVLVMANTGSASIESELTRKLLQDYVTSARPVRQVSSATSPSQLSLAQLSPSLFYSISYI